MNKILKSLIILSLLMAGSCINWEKPVYTQINAPMPTGKNIQQAWVDVKFNAAEKMGIEDGILEWNYVMNGKMEVKVMGDYFGGIEETREHLASGDWLIMKVERENSMMDQGEQEIRAAARVDKIGGQLMWISEYFDAGNIREAELHEEGHLLGLRHAEGETLMNHYFTMKRYRCVDQETAWKLAEIKGWDQGEMNYCLK